MKKCFIHYRDFKIHENEFPLNEEEKSTQNKIKMSIHSHKIVSIMIDTIMAWNYKLILSLEKSIMGKELIIFCGRLFLEERTYTSRIFMDIKRIAISKCKRKANQCHHCSRMTKIKHLSIYNLLHRKIFQIFREPSQQLNHCQHRSSTSFSTNDS